MRIVWLVTFLTAGVGLIAYIVAWIAIKVTRMPASDSGETLSKDRRRKDPAMGVEDKASHSIKNTKGKVKETTGRATDNEDLEKEGKADQAEASVKDSVERLRDAADNVKDAFKK